MGPLCRPDQLVLANSPQIFYHHDIPGVLRRHTDTLPNVKVVAAAYSVDIDVDLCEGDADSERPDPTDGVAHPAQLR